MPLRCYSTVQSLAPECDKRIRIDPCCRARRQRVGRGAVTQTRHASLLHVATACAAFGRSNLHPGIPCIARDGSCLTQTSPASAVCSHASLRRTGRMRCVCFSTGRSLDQGAPYTPPAGSARTASTCRHAALRTQRVASAAAARARRRPPTVYLRCTAPAARARLSPCTRAASPLGRATAAPAACTAAAACR